MLPFPNKAKSRIILASGLLLAFILAAYYFDAFSLLKESRPILPPDTEVAKDAKIKITTDTDIVQKIIYLKCNEEEVYNTKPADNLVGLNIYQVKKIYSGWTVDKFDTKAVEMSLKVDSYCREHANNQFIGIKDGFVAVYCGRPGPKAILKEVTPISVNRLSSEDIQELQRGMVVQSREDLLRTLEGMQSR